jgi:hypothetical protein
VRVCLLQEAGLMASLRHPNIVQFMAVSTSPPAVITGMPPLAAAVVTIRHPMVPQGVSALAV